MDGTIGGYGPEVLETQDLIDGRYRLTDLLSAGGMGEIWRATDQILGRTVAVKLLRRPADSLDAAVRFRGEARAMAALSHPGVADVYDYGETTRPDGSTAAYIIMAWVDGQPLSELIAEAGRLSPLDTASVIAQTTDALQAVHEVGIVHRDVKPANLVVQDDGHVVLIDFGVAITANAPDLTGPNEVVGTVLYMAPEQVTSGAITPATDIYALGAVAYHCLVGRPPFVGGSAVSVAVRHLSEDPPPLPGDVPAELRHVVATAMAKDPEKRYRSAAAMADAICNAATAAVLADDPQATVLLTTASPPGHAVDEQRRRPGRRRKRGLVAAGTLAVLAALLAALALADPSGTVRPPWIEPNPPAATANATPAVGTNAVPGGGAGGRQVPQPGASTGSDAIPPPAASSAADPSAATGDTTDAGAGSDGQPATPAPDDNEPTAEPEPEPPPEQTPAAEPEPTAAAGDQPEPGETVDEPDSDVAAARSRE